MHYSLIYPIQKLRGRTQVLMGYMLSGAWQGHFNGFGGKIENESPAECAIRELKEESGIEIKSSQLDYKGHVLFQREGQASDDDKILVDVFTARLDGRKTVLPKMTEYALPCWFDSEELPLVKMPPFDEYWIGIIFKKPNTISEYTITHNDHEVTLVRGITKKERE